MADNTKKFKIVINGITESVDAVKKLNDQLKETEGIIDRLKNAKVEVKVSAGETKTAKVSGNKSNDADKVALEIEKEKTKQLQMQNDELREQYIQREQLKQANKEALQEIKDQAKGYAEINDGVKTYANTMNGMKAELRDIKAELHNTELGSEEFENLTLRAAQLNEQLKELEFAYGQYGRNVGNYTNSWIEAMEEVRHYMEADFGETTEITLEKLQDMSKGAQAAFKNMTPDNANYEKVKDDIAAIGEAIAKMKEQAKGAGDEMARLSEGISVSIDGVEYKFKSVEEAMGDMRKRLYEMKIAGQENTPVFRELMQTVQDFQREVATTNSQIQAMSKTSSTISNVISVFKGVSGIAAMGQGLMGLFGGKSEELDKMISKFTSLTLLLNGLNSLQDELTSGNSAFAKGLQNINQSLNSTLKFIGGIPDKIPYVKEISKYFGEGAKNLKEWASNATAFNDYQDMVVKTADKMSDLYGVMENLTSYSETLNKSLKQLNYADLVNLGRYLNGDLNFDELTDEAKAFFNEMKNGSENVSSITEKIKEFAEAQKKADEETYKFTQQSKKATDAIGRMGVVGKGVVKSIQLLQRGLNKLGLSSITLTKGITGLSFAFKALMKSTLILAAIQLLAEGIEWLTEKIKGLLGIMTEDEIDTFASKLNEIQVALDNMAKEYEIKVKLGDLGEFEAQMKKLYDQLQGLSDTQRRLFDNKYVTEWINELKKVNTAAPAWEDFTDTEKLAVETLKEFATENAEVWEQLKDGTPEEVYEGLSKAIEDCKISAEGLDAIVTVFGQSEDAAQKFIDRMSNIDWDLNDIGGKVANIIGNFFGNINKARDAAADATKKMKDDIKSLEKQNIELSLQLDPSDAALQREKFEKEMDEMAKSFGLKFDSAGKVLARVGTQLTQYQKEMKKVLEENYELQEKILNKTIEDAQKKKKDDSDKDAKDKLKKQRAEENARLELLKEGLDKEIAILEQKRKEELQDAAETGKSRETINAIYDKRILEATKKYEDERTKIIEDNNKRIRDIEAKHKQEMLDMRRSNEDTNTDTAMGSNENQNITVKRNITYDTTTTGNDNVNAQKDYYEKLLAEETRYINEKEQLEVEAAKREHQRQIEDEVARFNSLRESNAQELEERKKALDEMVEQGKITQEEANEMLDKLNEAHMSTEAEQQRQHLENLAAIKKHGEEVITNIHKQAEDERQQATMEALNNMMAATQDFYNDIDKVMERAQKRKTNSAGFIDYGAYRKSIKDALDATKQAAQQIEAEKKRLQDALNNKQISFDDFQKAMKQLNQFAEDVKDKAKELQRTLASSFNTWLGNMMNNINQYTSVLSGMFDTINEMYTRELDAQQDALDKKQEMYDEELEMLEEQLSKQEELTEQHKDKINSTEDELKTARGDRRQALIESLAAEKKAAEESMKQERRLVEDKKKNQQKQEQLKKEQDALEKRRRQQEKKAAIVQATISGLTAVANAMSVPPYPVGLALSIVAGALTAANVAQIAAQQYGKGGLLSGESHSGPHGGIPVGNTGITVEGNEYIIRKESTMPNLPLLEYINNSKRQLTKNDLVRFYDDKKGNTLINKAVQTKFAEGGRLPQLNVNVKDLINNVVRSQDDRPIVVSVVDIVNATDDLRTVQALAGVGND